jgi:hypothetical protein
MNDRLEYKARLKIVISELDSTVEKSKFDTQHYLSRALLLHKL